MAKKKKRRLMTDIYAEFPNANIYGEGDDMQINRGGMSNQIPIDIATPQAQYNPSQFQRVNPIKYLTMSEQDRAIQNSERMRYNEWKKANPQPETTETNPSGGNTNWGGVIGAAATGIINGIKDNDWSTKEGRTRGIFQSLGFADAANNWLADTSKGDANLTEMHNRINDATNRYITDSNDTQGAFSAIKNNNNINLINPTVKGLNEKDFRQSWGSYWRNTLTGGLQGAAAGSVGGPWGALWGGVAGIASGLLGGFGRKNRARKAYEEYKNNMNYLQKFAGNFNSLQKLNQQQSNENLLNNGLKQQQIQDLSNIRAFGGNLFGYGDEMEKSFTEDPSDPTVPDVGTSPIGLERMPYSDAQFYPKEMPKLKLDPKNPLWQSDPAYMKQWQQAADYNTQFNNQRRDLFQKNLDEIKKANQYVKLDALGSIYDYDLNPNGTELSIKATKGLPLADVAAYNMHNVRVKKPEDIFKLQTGAGGQYWSAREKNPTYRHVATTDDDFLTKFDAEHNTNYRNTSKEHEVLHGQGLDAFYEKILANKGLLKLSPDKQAIYNTYPIQKSRDENGYYYLNKDYWKTPTEIISRRQEARKALDLHPRDILTKDFLNREDVKKVIKDNHLDMYNDDQLLKLFNEVANNNNSNSYDNVAAYGGNFNMSLISPNMIEMQNRALNNQKYKYDNQMQPLGFIDGGKTPNPGFPRLACGGYIKKYDFGGSLGLELPEDMQYYANGGTHEENPNGGIQVGVDNQGTPNLVEQGEFRYGDYVFSDRINVDASLLSEFNLAPATKHQNKKANKGKLSYADMAKKMVKKAGDLNDPITKDTIDANMSRLQQAQDAQKYKAQQDQEYADYKSALKTPTQGNPMYGSMKYNGMGDVNQGLNEGDAMAGSAIDNSELSNVNRSGNPMMAAYGGNIFGDGTRNLQIGNKIGTRKIVEPALNWDNLALQRSLPNPQFISGSNYDDAMFEPVDYTQMARSNDSNWVNDKWNAYGELNNYYTPEQIANMRGTYGMSISGGVDKPFVQALQNDLKKRGYYTGSIDGVFGPKTRMALDKMNNTNAWTGENGKYIAPVTTQTTTSPTGGSNSYSYKYDISKTTSDVLNKDAVSGDPTISKDATASGSTFNPQQNIDKSGDVQRLSGAYAVGKPFDSPTYGTLGRFAANAKFLPLSFADSRGFTNFDYDPNLAPNYDLVAAGKTGNVPRTADHSGMYREADLFDINAANNASQAMNMAMLRGIVNNSNNNRGFLGAQTSALDYNGLMGTGQNFATMFDKNNASRISAYQDNKQTEQTNVDANNQMYRDNQQAAIQGKQMELNTLAQSMADQTQKELYADRTNREAHDNIAGTQNLMWNNGMQFLMDEAKRNDLYNKFNSDASQMWYYDKKLGKYMFKGDPATAYLGDAIRANKDVNSLDADLQNEYNNYVAKVGSENVQRDYLDSLVERQAQRNQEAEAKSTAERNRAMQTDIDFMRRRFNDLENYTITDKDKQYRFFDYLNSPEQINAMRDFLTNKRVEDMTPQEYQNYKALLDNWSRTRDNMFLYRNQLSPYDVASTSNTTWVDKKSAYGGHINTKKKRNKRYTDI